VENNMPEKKKVVKKSSKTDEAISHILGVLESIDGRLTSLESREAADYDDLDSLDSRLFKVEGRMGL
jgi:hypothetical protein